jgi:dTMP kinase
MSVPFSNRPQFNALSHRATIETELRAGNTVVCDRYAFSGVAFSASKPSLSYEWCKAPDVSLPAPDAVIFLDVSPEVARQRGGYGEERYEKEEMQIRVREIFSKIETDTVQSNSRLVWSTIDASGTLDEVERRIRHVVEPLLGGITEEIQRLWV